MTDTPAKHAYTMSPAALGQRRAAQPLAVAAGTKAGKSTGPRTEEGKAAVCRNGWKHGRYSAINRQSFGLGAASVSRLFGKPCAKTCPYHPDNPKRTESPCALVLDGLTHAGGSCLDKTVYVTALQSLMAAMSDGEMDGMHGLLATELAANLQIVHHIREEISTRGVLVPVYERNKEGDIIIEPGTKKPMIFDLKINPAIAALAKFTEVHGINFAEMMATPRAREKLRDEDDAASGLASAIGAIFQRAGNRLPPPKGRLIEADAEDETLG
jgi:hypothetical protein